LYFRSKDGSLEDLEDSKPKQWSYVTWVLWSLAFAIIPLIGVGAWYTIKENYLAIVFPFQQPKQSKFEKFFRSPYDFSR